MKITIEFPRRRDIPDLKPLIEALAQLPSAEVHFDPWVEYTPALLMMEAGIKATEVRLHRKRRPVRV